MPKTARPVIAPDGTRYPSVTDALRALSMNSGAFYQGRATWDAAAGAWRVRPAKPVGRPRKEVRDV